MTLEQILRNITIDAFGEDTIIDYYGCPEDADLFIHNVKQLSGNSLDAEISSVEDLQPYIDEEDDCWMQIICNSAYCAARDIEVDEDTEIIDSDLVTYNIHWNTFNDLYTECETDIDLG